MSGLVLAIVATAVAAASSVEASSSGFVQTRFVIGGGPDPPCTQTSYANVRAVGCTFLHADSDEVNNVASAQQMAKLCAANNLTCALPLVAIKAVAPGANVWGYFLHDEPRAKDFAGIAKQVADVRALRPTALSFVNLLGFANLSSPAAYRGLYGTDTYDEYVDGFISTVKPDILSYDCYPNPVKSEMDLFHFNLQLMRNKSLAAKIPLWTYIWLNSNGRGHGAGFYRWQLFIAAAHGVRAIMQWSLSPCANIHACGPRDRWAPYPCLLDKHGNQFKPVADMARVEHQKLLALGPLLLEMTSVQVLRIVPQRVPIVLVAGMPLRSISPGAWLLGHFRRDDGGGDCVMVVNDDPSSTAFPSLDLSAGAREVSQETGELGAVAVPNDAPDVAGFHLFFAEGSARLFCWSNSTALA